MYFVIFERSHKELSYPTVHFENNIKPLGSTYGFLFKLTNSMWKGQKQLIKTISQYKILFLF